jgi:hypothetical protein
MAEFFYMNINFEEQKSFVDYMNKTLTGRSLYKGSSLC